MRIERAIIHYNEPIYVELDESSMRIGQKSNVIELTPDELRDLIRLAELMQWEDVRSC